MVGIFAVTLILTLYYVVNFAFEEQDTLLDTHELYFYSKIVSSWEIDSISHEPDTVKMKYDLSNLGMMCSVYKTYPSQQDTIFQYYWGYNDNFNPLEDYYSYGDSQSLGPENDIYIPHYVSYGYIKSLMANYVESGDYAYYFAVNYNPPDILTLRFITASLMAIFFLFILFVFIRKYLKPILLMKRRVTALESGDLDSTIPIFGNDELADLSKTINKMILDIKLLLTNKQRLLADVSHELRSPLARMRLQVEMLPEHKNINRLKTEIAFLEGIISNLLLSDKLSTPYSNLDFKPCYIDELVDKSIAMFPDAQKRIVILGNIHRKRISVDSTKIILAIRNLIDNALKHSDTKEPVTVKCRIHKGRVEFIISDKGQGISKENILKIIEPFFRIERQRKKVAGFGLGLSITKKIIEAHKGQLKISSELGVGSSFTILLPLK
jgi:signal transduction histidine kinase